MALNDKSIASQPHLHLDYIITQENLMAFRFILHKYPSNVGQENEPCSIAFQLRLNRRSINA